VRTGILGGTFDPIHLAHLHAGETALSQGRLDRVLFMPAGDPWQKADQVLTPAQQRLEMVRRAVEEVDGFQVDEREIERGGPTYTIDTLLMFPPDEELFLIVGADAALGVPSWHRWKEVVDRAGFLVIPRLGTDIGRVRETLPAAVVLDMALLEISATAIRAMAAAGEPYRFLVPPRVHEFIETTGLYAQVGRDDRVGAALEQEEAQ
jgi:nicotinate-nucleotide adenylyltransferase